MHQPYLSLRLLCLCLLIKYTFASTFYLKLLRSHSPISNSSTCLILSQEVLQKSLDFSQSQVLLTISPLPPQHDQQCSLIFPPDLIEIFAPSANQAKSHLLNTSTCSSFTKQPSHVSKSTSSAPPQVHQLLSTGNSSNRIDVVFMGDGYTSSESSQFLSDVNRLIEGTFVSGPFTTFLPLLSIWAVFVPSEDSGIGYNGLSKNTPFRLYRPRGPLRSIFTRNPSRARSTCRLTGRSGCDYPILLANDPFYGGLGGEFAIATSSLTSGLSILRHELGHNFASVGEEYDSGQVYSGANSSPSLRRIKWTKWLSQTNSTGIKEERMISRISSYPSSDLNRRSLVYTFRSDGSYANWYLHVTLSGVFNLSSIQVTLDDVQLSWQTDSFNTSGDKALYDWSGSPGLSRGQHTLRIKSVYPIIGGETSKIPREVGSVGLYEYGEDYHIDPEYIGAFPTWDINGRKTYRPTNAGCLMRNMSHHKLCSVCNESIWLQFLRRISLIDNLKVEGNSTTLTTLPLGQFRFNGATPPGEQLLISWYRNGQEVEELRGLTQIQTNLTHSSTQRWEVRVELLTSEVRNDPRGYLKERKRFTVS